MSLQATAFFLTYSRTNLTRGEVEHLLRQSAATKRYIVALEHHEDGGEHIHAVVEYARKRVGLSPKHFDIKDEHPNVLVWDRVTTYDQWLSNHWNYCLKEDTSPVTSGDAPQSRKRTRDEHATECLKKARTEGVDAALEHYKTVCPFEYIRNPNSCVTAFTMECNGILADPPPRSVSDFNLTPLQPSLPANWHTLFLYGETGCGKTEFARALLPMATVVRHIDQLKSADLSHGVIFDDFEVGHWPPTSVIHLLDWDLASGINVKYGHVRIPAHTRKIFTHNDPFYIWLGKMSDSHKAACQRRVNDIHVSASLKSNDSDDQGEQ